MKKAYPYLLSTGILLGIWQLLASVADQPMLIPTVPGLWVKIGELIVSPAFYQSVGATIVRGIIGMALSLAAAGIAASLFSRHEWIYLICKPLLSFMRSVPVISFILLALIFLKSEEIPLLIAFLTIFPLLTENLTQGIKKLRPEWEFLALTFKISGYNYYLHIIYPQLKPFLMSGMTSAIGFGWRAIIMGEVLSQCTFGIGTEMKKAQSFIDVAGLMAWTIVAILISFLFDRGIDKLKTIRMPIFFSGASFGPIFPKPQRIVLNNISFSYPATAIFRQFSMVFQPSRIYGISAPSGTGKSTLLKLIAGTLSPSCGTIVIDRTQGIACMFQDPELISDLSVMDNVMLPLAAIYSHRVAKRKASHILRLTEIEALASRMPHQLSHGQQQRVSIARALLYPSSVLLMDEPFQGLDNGLILRIAEHIRKLHCNSKQTIIFVTHKPEELSLLADETIKL